MITKFDSSYYGTADMENLGYTGHADQRALLLERGAGEGDAQGRGLRQVHGRARLRHVLDGRASFPARRHGTDPEPPDDGDAPVRRDEEPEDRLRLQRRADVASAAARGRLCDGRHPDRRAGDLRRRRAAITPARSRPSARRCSTRTANREIFEEGVDILFKAFEGKPFSHKGKYYTIPPEVPYRGYTLKEITLVPAPERLPVECWQPIQSGSERAFDFMAKHGICGVIGGGSAEGGAVERHMIGFQAAYARRGIKLELGERLALGYQFHIASSREQAIREAAPHYEENMKMFGELRLVRALTDEQIAAMRDPTARRHDRNCRRSRTR